MKKVLSLDISSSTIGWGLIYFNNNLITFKGSGHIKPPSKAAAEKKSFGLSYRLNEIAKSTQKLLTDVAPDVVIVEDYARKFSRGKSSANTIIVLATVNETVSLEVFKFLGTEAVRLPVARIRKILRDEYGEPISDKDDIINFMAAMFSDFTPVKNKVGNTKKECFDEADALAAGLAYCVDKLKR